MRVLLLEPESENRLKLRRLLEPEGHEVVAPPDAERALAHLRGRAPDLVICVIEPGASEGARFIERSRGLCSGVAGLLMSAFHSLEDPEISAAMLSFTRADFLPKSATVQELSEALRRLVKAPVRLASPEQRSSRPLPATTVLPDRARPARVEVARPEPVARIEAPRGHGRVAVGVDQRNLRTLARLWVTRATGTVCLSNGPGGAEGWASVRDGGVVDEESRRLLDAGISGGELLFEAVEIISPGDREAMSLLLWTAARDPEQHAFAQNSRFQALTRTSSTAASAFLPLAATTRRLLAAADGHVPLGQAMASEGIDPESVSLDLYALVRLGLLTLQTPIAPLSRPTALGLDHGQSGTATLAHREGDPLSRTASDLPRTMPSGRRAVASTLGAALAATSNGQAVSRPPPGRAGSTMTSRTAGSSGSSYRERSAANLRGATPSVNSRTGSASDTAHARAHIGPVLKRLQREAGDLRTASPAVVLGLPPDTSSDRVRQHVERLRERYTGLANDTSLPQEARELAGQILERIEEAAKNFGKARSAMAAVAMDEERLLIMGRDLIARQQWEQAEKVLGKARQLKADHAGVLANLGWAKLNNPARDREARAGDARELLALAEQFDPNNAEGQRYLAELLYKLGEYKAALPRAERALKANPENAAIAALLRKLRARLAAGN